MSNTNYPKPRKLAAVTALFFAFMSPRMPTILRKNGFRFFFYSSEGDEPPHIHIVGRGGDMKIWLRPIEISRVYKLAARDQRDALKITEENVKLFLNAWKEWNESGR